MLKKALVTGVSGFAGSYLAEHLLSKKEYSVSGTYLTQESLKLVADTQDKLELIQADLTKKDKIFDLVSLVKPDFVFHLAALSSPKESFKDPAETIVNNILSELYLLEALKKEGLINTRILVISSADIYGMVSKEDLPIDENTKLMPADPYSVSKIAQDFLGLQYFLSQNLQVIRVRPFNHIGPRQSPSFVLPSFCKRVAEIEKGDTDPVLQVGNLESKRDFTDVRDMVKAYALVLEKGKSGDVYNIGSGVSYKISDILDKLLSFSKVKIRVEIDKSLFRPVDIPELRCDNSKFKKATGWEPMTPIEETIKDTLDYWRNII